MAQGNIRQLELNLGLMSGQETASAQQMANAMNLAAQAAKVFNSQLKGILAQTTETMKLAQQMQQMQLAPPSPPPGQGQLFRTENIQVTRNYMGRYMKSIGPVGPLPPPQQDMSSNVGSPTQDAQTTQQAMAEEALPAWQQDLQQLRQQHASTWGGLSFSRHGMPAAHAHLQGLSQVFEMMALNSSMANKAAQGEQLNFMQNIAGNLSPEAWGSFASQAQQMANVVGAGYTVKNAVQNTAAPIGQYVPTPSLGGSPAELIKQLIDPFSIQSMAAGLGYPRGGSLFGLPISSPFSPAGAQGYQMMGNILNSMMQPGINISQAEAIQGATAGYGFGGNLGSNVISQILNPLWQKYQGNPDIFLQNFGSALRTGVMNVTQLSDSIDKLGQAAQNAHMNINDTMNAVGQVSQVVQSMGGLPQTGIQLGTMLQTNTGLPASSLMPILQSPITSAVLAETTGVMPQLQGQLPANTLYGGMAQSISMLEKMIPPGALSSQAGTEVTTNPATGQPWYSQTVSPTNLRNALIANWMGIQPQAFNRIAKNLQAQTTGADIENAISMFQNETPGYGLTKQQVQELVHNQGFWNRAQGEATPTKHFSGQGWNVESYNSDAFNGQGSVTLRNAQGQTQTILLSQLLQNSYNSSMAAQGGYTHQSLIQSLQNDLWAKGGALGKVGPNQMYFSNIMSMLEQSHGLWNQYSGHGAMKGTLQGEIAKIQNIAHTHGIQTAEKSLLSDIGKRTEQQASTTSGQLGNVNVTISLKGQAANIFNAQAQYNPSTANQVQNSFTGGTLMNQLMAEPLGINPLNTSNSQLQSLMTNGSLSPSAAP
jgi:hypothetical protein